MTVSVLHVLLTGFSRAGRYFMCTLHVYKSSVWPVASCNLFLDIQVVTLLLREFTLHL